MQSVQYKANNVLLDAVDVYGMQPLRRRTTNVGALSSRRASLTSHLLRGSSRLVLYWVKSHAAPHGRLPRFVRLLR